MQIKLGEKIKELRKRDGRKQEDLAVALGVTNQAVSRWEANGGYPDMEMIPAIANYFHITIDELFGYNSDRETKINAYIEQADQMLEDQDMTPCVQFLRNAISEFPSEWRLQYSLAFALRRMGFQKHGGYARAAKGGDYFQYDTDYHAQNEYWKEAIALYETILREEIDADFRSAAINSLISLYSLMGDSENAERTAGTQPSVHKCREVLLARDIDGEKGERYRGEALLALMHELNEVSERAVQMKPSLLDSQSGIDKRLAVAKLYESIIDDGNYGVLHSDLCRLYLRCFSIAGGLNDFESALNYFDTAFNHFVQFRQLLENQGLKNFQYTASLVSQVKEPKISFANLDPKNLEWYTGQLPAELMDKIRSNPKYAPMFAQ